MLGMKTYTKDYIDACRARIAADVAAFKDAGAKELEATFFNNLVLKLQYMFEHRLSGAEGKDGNPLNEVRVLANSLVLNDGKLQVARLPQWPNSAVANLTLPPERSVLGLKPGDTVALTRDDFVKLAKAYFEEIQQRYA
jgi:hypothetical protein